MAFWLIYALIWMVVGMVRLMIWMMVWLFALGMLLYAGLYKLIRDAETAQRA